MTYPCLVDHALHFLHSRTLSIASEVKEHAKCSDFATLRCLELRKALANGHADIVHGDVDIRVRWTGESDIDGGVCSRREGIIQSCCGVSGDVG